MSELEHRKSIKEARIKNGTLYDTILWSIDHEKLIIGMADTKDIVTMDPPDREEFWEISKYVMKSSGDWGTWRKLFRETEE